MLDAVTAEVVEALREAQVESVLLRGPAISRWLYADESLRPYSDVDLLIPSERDPHAAAVLRALGFAFWRLDGALPRERSPHAYSWVRERDRAVVDVHHTLRGAGGAPTRVWEVIAAETERALVGASEVRVPAVPVRAAIVALHAAHHGRGSTKPLNDLTLALASLSEAAWREAASVAESLEAVPAFATGLRLLPGGREIADRLGLPHQRSTEIALLASTSPPVALSLEWLASEPGLRAKVVFAARKLAPAPAFMWASSPLARRGRVGLVLSYGVRLGRLARHAWPGFRAWRRARREAG
jgi:hypothetical protein